MMYTRTFSSQRPKKSYQTDTIDGYNFNDLYFSLSGEELFIEKSVSEGKSKEAAQRLWNDMKQKDRRFWREQARKERRAERRDDRDKRQDARKRNREGDEARAKQLGVKGYKAKKVAFATSRGPFLALLALNFRGLSTRIDAFLETPQVFEIEKTWYKVGGSWDAFLDAVAKGKDKRPLLCGAKCKSKLPANFNFADYSFGGPYNYPTGVEETATTAAAAAPVTAKIVGVLGTLASIGTAVGDVTGKAAKISEDVEKTVGADEKADDATLTPEEQAAANAQFADAVAQAVAATEAAEKQAEKELGGNSNTLLIGLAAVVVLLMFTRR